MRDGFATRVRPGNDCPALPALPARAVVVAWVCLGAGFGALGCGGHEPATGVEPLPSAATAPDGPGETGPPSEVPAPEEPAETDPAREGAASPPPAGHEAAELRSEVEDLMAAFDRAVSVLAGDPEAAGDDRHPLSAAWLAVVVPGSPLDQEVRSRLLTQATADNMRYIPDQEGTIYRHRPLDIDIAVDSSVTWDYCGYSPGIGIDRDTGEVLDDRRSTIRGRATAIRGPVDNLVMLRFTDSSVDDLAPGKADPCPGLSAGARQRERATGTGRPR